MGFRINTNVASLQAQSSISKVNKESQESFSKLSSGTRIAKASDDAAGMAISEKLKAEIRSNQQANRNANDGISMIQVAEGGLTEATNILTRLRELSMQSASDTIGDTERAMSNMEYQQLKSEMDRISKVTAFGETKLLDGSGERRDFQVGTGANSEQDRISFDPGQLNSGTEAMGIDDLDILSKDSAQGGLDKIDTAIEKISSQRALLGSLQNRLTATSNNLEVYTENLSAANSRIRDVDYAVETAKQARNQIVTAAATSVLSQANMNGQNVLKLIA